MEDYPIPDIMMDFDKYFQECLTDPDDGGKYRSFAFRFLIISYY